MPGRTWPHLTFDFQHGCWGWWSVPHWRGRHRCFFQVNNLKSHLCLSLFNIEPQTWRYGWVSIWRGRQHRGWRGKLEVNATYFKPANRHLHKTVTDSGWRGLTHMGKRIRSCLKWFSVIIMPQHQHSPIWTRFRGGSRNKVSWVVELLLFCSGNTHSLLLVDIFLELLRECLFVWLFGCLLVFLFVCLLFCVCLFIALLAWVASIVWVAPQFFIFVEI